MIQWKSLNSFKNSFEIQFFTATDRLSNLNSPDPTLTLLNA